MSQCDQAINTDNSVNLKSGFTYDSVFEAVFVPAYLRRKIHGSPFQNEGWANLTDGDMFAIADEGLVESCTAINNQPHIDNTRYCKDNNVAPVPLGYSEPSDVEDVGVQATSPINADSDLDLDSTFSVMAVRRRRKRRRGDTTHEHEGRHKSEQDWSQEAGRSRHRKSIGGGKHKDRLDQSTHHKRKRRTKRHLTTIQQERNRTEQRDELEAIDILDKRSVSAGKQTTASTKGIWREEPSEIPGPVSGKGATKRKRRRRRRGTSQGQDQGMVACISTPRHGVAHNQSTQINELNRRVFGHSMVAQNDIRTPFCIGDVVRVTNGGVCTKDKSCSKTKSSGVRGHLSRRIHAYTPVGSQAKYYAMHSTRESKPVELCANSKAISRKAKHRVHMSVLPYIEANEPKISRKVYTDHLTPPYHNTESLILKSNPCQTLVDIQLDHIFPNQPGDTSVSKQLSDTSKTFSSDGAPNNVRQLNRQLYLERNRMPVTPVRVFTSASPETPIMFGKPTSTFPILPRFVNVGTPKTQPAAFHPAQHAVTTRMVNPKSDTPPAAGNRITVNTDKRRARIGTGITHFVPKPACREIIDRGEYMVPKQHRLLSVEVRALEGPRPLLMTLSKSIPNSGVNAPLTHPRNSFDSSAYTVGLTSTQKAHTHWLQCKVACYKQDQVNYDRLKEMKKFCRKRKTRLLLPEPIAIVPHTIEVGKYKYFGCRKSKWNLDWLLHHEYGSAAENELHRHMNHIQAHWERTNIESEYINHLWEAMNRVKRQSAT